MVFVVEESLMPSGIACSNLFDLDPPATRTDSVVITPVRMYSSSMRVALIFVDLKPEVLLNPKVETFEFRVLYVHTYICTPSRTFLLKCLAVFSFSKQPLKHYKTYTF